VGVALRAWWKSKRILLTLCLLALAFGVLASYAARSSYFASNREQPGAKGAKQPVAVAALGRIEPHSEIINVGAGVSPDRLESLFVARGDLVKKDQVLGYLGGYAEQIAQRDMYRAQLEEARLRLRTKIELNRSRIEAAEIHQRQILEVSPLRIAAQEATIESLEAKLANDKDILDSHAQLFSRGVTSRRLREDQKAMVAQGEANVASARARLAELKHQFEVDTIDAEVQVKLARAQLQRAQAEFPIASLEAQIAAAEARAYRLTLYAPVDGRILNIKIKPGEDASSGPVLTMGDTSVMRAVAEVYETDIINVRIGQVATITSRALPRAVRGKVVRIGNMVFKNDVLNVDPAARADARVVEVWIDLDDATLTERLTNLTVDVVINTGDSDAAVARSGRARGLDVLGRPAPDRLSRILAELMLLYVSAAENNVTDGIEQHDSDGSPPWEIVGVFDEVIRLNGVSERHPDEVAPAEHPSEVLVLDVLRCQDRFLVQVIISDVPEMERTDEHHRHRHDPM
jgi:HlyD family secretion protein